MTDISRRKWIGVVAGTAVSLPMLTGCAVTGKKEQTMKKLQTYKNDHFYKADGTFDENAAKQAYYEMMEYYNYPIVERLRGEDFWTLDFNMGKFTEVGMAGIFWVNNQEHDYLGHEIYLLPGQIIPEHWHVATKNGHAKLEAWQVRYGSVTLYAEGTPTPGVDERIPPTHREIAVARTETKVLPGEVGTLANAMEKHWMLAGPEGAIVTEYATYHDMDGLRFSHPDVSL
jgi:D-lyxose ketol-isomerase